MQQEEQGEEEEDDEELEDADVTIEASSLDDLAKLITVEEVCTSSEPLMLPVGGLFRPNVKFLNHLSNQRGVFLVHDDGRIRKKGSAVFKV